MFEMVYVVLPRICVGCDTYMGDVMFERVYSYIYICYPCYAVCQ